MKIKINENSYIQHYRFRGDEKTWAVTVTREEFPSHRKLSTTVSISYGGGCVYLSVWKKL